MLSVISFKCIGVTLNFARVILHLDQSSNFDLLPSVTIAQIFKTIFPACECNTNGTANGDDTCDQATGQCNCTENVEGLKCDTCSDGYYDFDSGCSGEHRNT